MRDPAPTAVHLKDYTPPAFLIATVDLDVDIHEEHTQVRARIEVSRNPKSAAQDSALELDGDELELLSVAIDGRTLAATEYRVDGGKLCIAKVPARFALETVVRIHPETNTKLEGFYASKTGLFTQCEAEGFRRISYFIDRPDVLARYTVTLHADKAKYPVLLANGNPSSAADESGGRHRATWTDPFPKPCYLFAMVAGKLDQLADTFTTASGRTVQLSIYVESGKLDQCAWAMDCLKRSMIWDERVFGLEVDLDHYMIVAVGDFNMGAMENKGLNIFNTKYVLARPDVATDNDYMFIDRVIAHEYFHNWTGNRVTCRDWFQLSLKEGLTVFRDQEYGADTYSRPVQRIQEVRALRAAQFPEDAGPMAHPIRPQSYMEIGNFYTATVYEKGAEVVRMIHTLLGAEKFRLGMDLYFKRHDGQAVTCDDFVQAMVDASGIDLGRFRRWYDQAGTPVLDIRGEYDATARRYTLHVLQSCPPTPGQPHKLPLHIPFAVGLVGANGADLLPEGTRMLSMLDAEHHFVFDNVPSEPVPSIARGFSAPAILNFDYSDDQLAHLLANDSDAFNRWEAGQRLAVKLILAGVDAQRTGKPFAVPAAFSAAFGKVLARAAADPAFTAEALMLPSETYLAEQMAVVDPMAIHSVRTRLRREIAAALKDALLSVYRDYAAKGTYSPDAASAGRRALRNACLGYLMELDDPAMIALGVKQFDTADNMTDSIAALSALANAGTPERTRALEAFYSRWKDEPLVVDKWLTVQATSRLPGTLGEVKRLSQHPAFDIRNPNKVYALLRAFFGANPLHFHAADGSGYAFAAERIIELDPINPQVASRLARTFDRWKKFDTGRQTHARAALESIRAKEGLSKDVLEVVSKALA